MNVAFLHLSDLHIKDNTHLSRVGGIVNSISNYEFDRLVIIVSGDIAFSGQQREYLIAKKFINKLVQNIDKNKSGLGHISRIFAPGNHDMKFDDYISSNELYDAHKSLQKDYKSTSNIKAVKKEIDKLDSYYNFAQKQNQYIAKEIMSNYIIDLDDYKIRANIVNSAIFSAYTDTNSNSNDKGLHFIQFKDSQKISNKNCDLSICIMHHSPEWFVDYSKHDLINALRKNVDLCFFGHEHVQNSYSLDFGENEGFQISSGGALDNHKVETSQFSFVILSTKTNEINNYMFTQNKLGEKYLVENPINKHLKPKSGNGFEFQLSSEFEDSFYIDKNTSIFTDSIFDVFVFPQLQKHNISSGRQQRINDLKNLENEINSNLIVCITGSKSSGKTTLSKVLFKKLEKTKIVVYLQSNELSKDVKLRRVIDNALRNQYLDSDKVIQHYNTKSKTDKICIIDNFHLIKNGNNKIDLLLQEFSKIVITSSDEFYFEEMMKISTSGNLLKSNTTELTIRPFVKSRREELIEKVFTKLVKNPFTKEKNELLEETIKYVKKQIKIINHTPYFTIMYAKDFIEKGNLKGQKNSVFNDVFEADLTYKLKDYCTDEIDIPTFKFICNNLAYEIYIDSKYPITQELILKVVHKYNDLYDHSVKPFEFINIAQSAGILSYFGQSTDMYFSTDNYLAYFVAKKIISIIDSVEGKTQLNSLLENILVRINSTILLFFSFLMGHRTELLSKILKKMTDLCQDVPEISFSNRNFTLEGENLLNDIEFPSDSDREETIATEELLEEKLIDSNEVIKVDNIFSLEIDPRMVELSKGVKAIRYLEIISKAIPDFFHSMLKEDKEMYINTLYSIPNKIIYIAINDVQNTFRENYDEIIKELREDNPLQDMNYMINNYLLKVKNFFAYFTVSMYDVVAQNAVDKNNINHFKKYIPGDDLSYNLEYLLLLTEVTSSENFGQEALKLYENVSDDIEKNIIRTIVYKHFAINKKIDYKLELEIQSKIFERKGKVPKLAYRRKGVS
ncbi:metallophosphoesterase [Mycoplasmatota bacterium WC44]